MRFDPFTSSSPASLGASGANVAGSTTCAATPGNGCPTVPGLLPSCESLPAWKLGAFTATTGAISVQPYPSSSSTPNFSRNAAATGSRSFSVPTSTNRKLANSSTERLRVYVAQNVGVESRNVALYFAISSPTAFASVGFGWLTTPPPAISGNQTVTVYPKE